MRHMSNIQPSAPTAGIPVTATKNEEIHMVYRGVLWLLFGVLLAILFAYWRWSPLITAPPTTVSGVSIFAVAYLEAQFVERIVEPFSVQGDKGDSQKKNPASKVAGQVFNFGRWREIDNLENEEKKSKGLSDDRSVRLAELKSQRMISIWGFSSFLAIILSYFTFGLFKIIGITFPGDLFGHALDAILSGVIIGGGTKPLHDLIGYLQEAKGKS
jgi:hypothetical protein